jgi:predicted anti-sigma-YlaC factor YlaD
MECKKCTDCLTAYLDRELKDADRRRIESHLDACQSCSSEYVYLGKAADLVETYRTGIVPRPGSWIDVRSRIMAAEPISQSPFFYINRWRVPLAVAAVLVLFILGSMQFHNAKKRELDHYISQYLIERDKLNYSLMISNDVMHGSKTETSTRATYTVNPFLETMVILPENPFR